jgi:hypothetical protein
MVPQIYIVSLMWGYRLSYQSTLNYLTMAQNTIQLTKKIVENTMNNRQLVTEQHIGDVVTLTIQGNGSSAQDVKTREGALVQSVIDKGTVAQKIIFNVKANSGIAMKNPINRQLLRDGVAAELAGDAETAHAKFDAYLNATKITFNLFTTDPMLENLGDRTRIEAEIMKVTTENGSLLTIDPKTIKVAKATKLGKTTFKFDLDEEEEDGEDAGAGNNQETPASGSGVKEPEVTV